MMSEHTVSRDSTNSLDVISNAIIKETFLGLPGNENSLSINKRQESKERTEDDEWCCTNNCFKWWFFHSSFQIPTKGDITTDLLNQRKQFYCCDVCSECLEIKLLNYCASSECAKEHCSDCFYNGCQLSCCCFTFILNSK
jgi:hypothetical protein